MAQFEVGKCYWGIRTGWDFDDIRRVKLLKEIHHNGLLIGYESKDMDRGAVGTCGIEVKYLFDSKAAAEDYRTQMAAAQVESKRKETDTPEKMLKYLLDRLARESDGYCDHMVNDDIRKRAQELFGIKF